MRLQNFSHIRPRIQEEIEIPKTSLSLIRRQVVECKQKPQSNSQLQGYAEGYKENRQCQTPYKAYTPINLRFRLQCQEAVYFAHQIPSEIKEQPPRCKYDISHVLDESKKVLILDLDETLVHAQDANMKSDRYISFVKGFTVQTAGINIRPYAFSFIKRMHNRYNIVIFTAGIQQYAQKIISILDPQRKYIKALFHRAHCFHYQGHYIKDVRTVSESVEKTVILDNSVHSFALQLSNGIPIIPFYDDQFDSELLRVERYLIELSKVADIRAYNAKKLRLHTLLDNQFMLSQLKLLSNMKRRNTQDQLVRHQKFPKLKPISPSQFKPISNVFIPIRKKNFSSNLKSNNAQSLQDQNNSSLSLRNKSRLVSKDSVNFRTNDVLQRYNTPSKLLNQKSMILHSIKPLPKISMKFLAQTPFNPNTQSKFSRIIRNSALNGQALTSRQKRRQKSPSIQEIDPANESGFFSREASRVADSFNFIDLSDNFNETARFNSNANQPQLQKPTVISRSQNNSPIKRRVLKEDRENIDKRLN